MTSTPAPLLASNPSRAKSRRFARIFDTRARLRQYLHVPIATVFAALTWAIGAPLVAAMSSLFARWSTGSETLTITLFALSAALVAFILSFGYGHAVQWTVGRLRPTADSAKAYWTSLAVGGAVSVAWIGFFAYSIHLLPTSYKTTSSGILVFVMVGAVLGLQRAYRTAVQR